MFTTELYAMGAPAAGAEGAGGNPLVQMFPLILIFVIFYFLLIRPQQTQAKERQAMLKAVKEGDKVVTIGGIYATVNKVENDDVLILKISEGVNIKATRSSVEKIKD